jgi:hypothetical protein
MVFSGQTGMGWGGQTETKKYGQTEMGLGGQTETELDVKQNVFSNMFKLQRIINIIMFIN